MRSTLGLVLTLSTFLPWAATALRTQENRTSSQQKPSGNNLDEEAARLAALLKSSDDDVRLDAVIRLSALRTSAAGAALKSASTDSSDEVRAAAIAGLARLEDPSFAPLVAARLAQDKSVLVRKNAAYALGKLKSVESITALTAALRDKEVEVRGAATVALGEYGDPAVIPALITGLSDKSSFVQEQSARGLARWERAAAGAVPTLIKLLSREAGHTVRLQAATTLGMIGDRSALPALENASHDSDPYLSRAATEAIKRINEPRQ